MPLPLEWIDSLFARMAVRYGASWLAKWNGIDIAAVKSDWAQELEGFASNPDAIKYGLVNLPLDFPPNAAQFKAICMNRPDIAPLSLAEGKAKPESVAKVNAKAAELIEMWRNRKPRQWVDDLRAKQARGETLSFRQQEALKSAEEKHRPEIVGTFTPIPVDVLPPAMRGRS